jgi:hypothetical protein
MVRHVVLAGMLVVGVGLLAGCQLVAGQLLAQFAFAISPSEVTIPAGGSRTVEVGIDPISGITLSTVTVRLVDPPAGISADPTPLIAFGDSSWTIVVAASVQAGQYDGIVAEAVAQGINQLPVTRKAEFTVIVTPP